MPTLNRLSLRDYFMKKLQVHIKLLGTDRSSSDDTVSVDKEVEVLSLPSEHVNSTSKENRKYKWPLGGLYSQKLQDLCDFGFSAGYYLRAHGFHLRVDENNRYLSEANESIATELGWWCATGSVVLYLVFVLYRLVDHHVIRNKDLDTGSIYLALTGMVLLFPLTFQLMFKIYKEEMQAHYSQFHSFYQHHSKIFAHVSRSGKRKEKPIEVTIAETFSLFLQYAVVFATAVIVVMNLLRPQMTCFLSSLDSNPSLLMRMVSSCYIAYLGYVWAADSLLLTTGFAGVLPLLRAMKQLRGIGIANNYRKRTLISTYVQIQLQMDLFNIITRRLWVPTAENSGIILTVIGIYGVIRLEGLLRLTTAIVGLLAFIGVFTIFWTLAQVYDNGTKTVEAFARHGVVTRRELRTLRPIRVQINDYGFIDPGMLLTMMDVIAKNAISMLLTC